MFVPAQLLVGGGKVRLLYSLRSNSGVVAPGGERPAYSRSLSALQVPRYGADRHRATGAICLWSSFNSNRSRKTSLILRMDVLLAGKRFSLKRRVAHRRGRSSAAMPCGIVLGIIPEMPFGSIPDRVRLAPDSPPAVSSEGCGMAQFLSIGR